MNPFTNFDTRKVIRDIRWSPISYLENKIFIFLSFSLLIGWQFSFWNCCKPFFIVVKLPAAVFLATCFKYYSRGLPAAFFTDIAPSRMFPKNSLWLIVCPNHEWCLFFKTFKSNLSSFSLWKSSSPLLYLPILILTFFSSTMKYNTAV